VRQRLLKQLVEKLFAMSFREAKGGEESVVFFDSREKADSSPRAE